MLGFHASATRGPIKLDGELEDARWFHADELRQGAAMLPQPHAIARRLIEEWLGGATASRSAG